jgi:DNA-binding response OmpR family regulator
MTVLYESTLPEPQEQGVRISDIIWDSKQHRLLIEDDIVKLTPTEYRLLYALRHGIPITYAQLARIAYGYEIDEKVRMMMDKYIDRIRGKLRGTGVYVYCVLNYGYLLLPENTPD